MRFYLCVLVCQAVMAVMLCGCATDRHASRKSESPSNSSCPTCSATATGSGTR